VQEIEKVTYLNQIQSS